MLYWRILLLLMLVSVAWADPKDEGKRQINHTLLMT